MARTLLFACTVLLISVAFGASTSKKSAQKTASAKTTARSASSSKVRSKSRKSKRSRRASWRRGQQKMDSARAREIQTALIREHYLEGSATGIWDQKSQKAMVKFQADNGWQTKVVPDSRALIKLGLGPNHDHLLNPESAMTGPIPARAAASPGAPSSSSVVPTASESVGVSQPR